MMKIPLAGILRCYASEGSCRWQVPEVKKAGENRNPGNRGRENKVELKGE
jgi:hypothetical protein